MVKFKELSENFGLMKLLNEFDTGSAKMDPGSEKIDDEQIGKFIGKVIADHEMYEGPKDFRKGNPLYNKNFISALRNLYIGSKLESHQEHEIHSDEKRIASYRQFIRQEYPHLYNSVIENLQ